MNFDWNPEKATLLLHIPKQALDPKLVLFAHQHGFIEKDHLHLTILSFQNGKKVLQAIPSGDRTTVLEHIKSFAETLSWNIEYIPKYFVLERTIPDFILNGQIETPLHTRRTIIQVLSVPDLTDFLKRVSENLGIHFDEPFAHVTLFSWSDVDSQMNQGIGLNSEADFTKYQIQEIPV